METNNNPRVALSKILVLAEYLQTRYEVPKFVANEISEIEQAAKAALTTPPRNCDVGTAEEQHARFVSYCDRCDCPMGCDHRKSFIGVLKPECASILKCFTRWAQMPYKEGGAK